MPQPLITTAPRLELRQDAPQTNCDGQNILFCGATGTCYTGTDGYIGCCSTTSCAARTTCIEHDQLSTQDCDINFGGCVPCTNAALPSCATLVNSHERQYGLYCDSIGGSFTTSYHNLVSVGSMAAPPRAVASQAPVASDVTSTTTSIDTTCTTSTVLSASRVTSTAPGGSLQTSIPAGRQPNAAQAGKSSSIGAPGAAVSAGLATDFNATTPTSHGLSGGGVAGVAIGSALVGAVAVGLAVWYFLRSRRRSEAAAAAAADDDNDENDGHNGFQAHHYLPPMMPAGGFASRAYPVEKGDDSPRSSWQASEVEGSPVPSQTNAFPSRSPSLKSRRGPASRSVSPESLAWQWNAAAKDGVVGISAGDTIAEVLHENLVDAFDKDLRCVSPPSVSGKGSRGFLSAEQAMAGGYRDEF